MTLFMDFSNLSPPLSFFIWCDCREDVIEMMFYKIRRMSAEKGLNFAKIPIEQDESYNYVADSPYLQPGSYEYVYIPIVCYKV
ncbi:hypothetical protein D3C81_1819860 [compost metagenome]